MKLFIASVSRLFTFCVALTLCGPLIVQPVAAQTADEVKQLLTTLAPQHQQDRPASIIVRHPVEIELDGGSIIADYGYTLDIEVPFEFGSARLTRTARRSIAALGRALESVDLAGYDYLIAGHTDAKGSAASNRELSFQRARTVRDALIENYTISPRRLHVIGWGESRLKTPRFPLAAANRRVEVTLIVPATAGPQVHPRPTAPDSDVTITIKPGLAVELTSPDGSAEQPAAVGDDMPSADDALPPCPSGRLGDPRDPTADLAGC
jgi:OOP family OmpA-OmpF porin